MSKNVVYVTSLNKRLFEHPAQKLVSSVTEFDCVPLTIYHENKYEIDKISNKRNYYGVLKRRRTRKEKSSSS